MKMAGPKERPEFEDEAEELEDISEVAPPPTATSGKLGTLGRPLEKDTKRLVSSKLQR